MTREKNRTHADRDDLTGEHKFSDMGQVILAVIFFVVWIADSFFLHYSTPLSSYVPMYIRLPIGMFILIPAWLFARKGLNIVFGEKRPEPEVISKGVFGMVRHPVYLGAVLLYLGLTVITLSIISAALWLLIAAFYHYISRHEEKLLTARFGDGYRKYMTEVPMWIPKLKL